MIALAFDRSSLVELITMRIGQLTIKKITTATPLDLTWIGAHYRDLSITSSLYDWRFSFRSRQSSYRHYVWISDRYVDDPPIRIIGL
jgi:hypothetical protein